MAASSIFHPDFAATPYWWEAYRPQSGALADVPAKARVAIIGAGYAGLNCAIELARSGVEVVVLDAGAPGIGGSTRNGGSVAGGLHVGKAAHRKAPPDAETAAALRQSAEDAFDAIDAVIEREAIACHWEKRGRFVGAWTPAHHAAQARQVAAHQAEGRTDFRLLSREEQRAEIGSSFYHGGLTSDRHGKLHPALYFRGLLQATRKHGAIICAEAAVGRITQAGPSWRVATSRGAIEVGDVVVTTNGYTPKAVPKLRRRLIPINSHVIATEELPADLAATILPTGRTGSETQRVLNYFRMAPGERRLVFGGRARFTERPDNEVARILHGFMVDRFPQLAGVRITHSWTGSIAMTFDGLPHAGMLDGLHYALGCNGSGVAMMSYLGLSTARRILKTANRPSGFERIPFPTMPFYNGDPRWLLPAYGGLLRLRDQLERGRAG